MFESGSNLIGLHMEKSRILDLTQNPADLSAFQDFRIGGITKFRLDFVILGYGTRI